jgi:hypothetical protein
MVLAIQLVNALVKEGPQVAIALQGEFEKSSNVFFLANSFLLIM